MLVCVVMLKVYVNVFNLMIIETILWIKYTVQYIYNVYMSCIQVISSSCIIYLTKLLFLCTICIVSLKIV